MPGRARVGPGAARPGWHRACFAPACELRPHPRPAPPNEALYPIVPIAAGLGLGVAIFSYDGELHVGLNADAELVPDLDKLREGVEEAFQSLVAGG